MMMQVYMQLDATQFHVHFKMLVIAQLLRRSVHACWEQLALISPAKVPHIMLSGDG